MATEEKKKKKEKTTFVREYEFNPKLNIKKLDIHQDPQGLWSGGIGSTVWDAGIVLSKYFETTHQQLIKNKSILEIGSGTGLVGMVCLRLGAKAVLFTDLLRLIPLLNKNLFENFYKHYSIKSLTDKLDTNKNTNDDDKKINEQENKDNSRPLLLSKELTWDNDKEMKLLFEFMQKHYYKFDSMFDCIVLSDCIYEQQFHKPLINTLQSVVKFIATNSKNKQIPSIIMSSEIRKPEIEQAFLDLLTKINWKYKLIDLSNIDPMYICDELVVYHITPKLQT